MISLKALSIRQPAAVRLIDTSMPTRKDISVRPEPSSQDTVLDPEPLLSALSLAPQPILPAAAAHPVFGQTSLPSLPVRPAEEAMDWEPAEESDWVRLDEREDWLRPQRFFAPEQPTGLEMLLERTTLAEPAAPSARLRPRLSALRSTRWWWIAAGIVCVWAIAFSAAWPVYFARGWRMSSQAGLRYENGDLIREDLHNGDKDQPVSVSVNDML